MQIASKCGLGQTSPNIFLSIVQHFREEIPTHPVNDDQNNDQEEGNTKSSNIFQSVISLFRGDTVKNDGKSCCNGTTGKGS